MEFLPKQMECVLPRRHIIVEGRMELVTSYMVHQLPRTQSDGECCLHLLWIAKLEGRMLITDNMHNSPFDCNSQNILSS